MRWWRGEKNAVLILWGLVFLILLYFEWISPGFFMADDNAGYFMPLFVHNWRAVVENHTLPFLNYYQYLGSRFLGQGQPAVFYPLMWVGLVISKILTGEVIRGVEVIVGVHVLISVLGMFVWLRGRKVEKVVAVLGALVWISFPYVITFSRAWVFMSYLLAYLPWGMWLFERVVLGNKSGWNYLLFAKVMLGLTGYPQWVVLVALFESVWIVIWYVKKRVNKMQLKLAVKKYVGLEVLSLLLSAVAWVPILVTMTGSAVRNKPLTWEVFISPHIKFVDLVLAQVGMFRDQAVFNTSSYLLFLGPLLLLFAVKFLRQRDAGVYLTILGFVSASWMSGVYYWVPLLNRFRYPVKFFVFGLVFMVVESLGVKWNRKVLLGLLLVSLGLNLGLVRGRLGREYVFGPSNFELPWDGGQGEWLKGLVGDNYRVVTAGAVLRNDGGNYLLGTYNHSTAFGVKDYIGFDGLISGQIFKEVGEPKMSMATLMGVPRDEDLGQIRDWGVGYWLLPVEYGNMKRIEELGWKEAGQREGAVVYEDPEASEVVELEGEGEVEWGINSVKVVVGEGLSKIILKVAPLDWYYVWVDGKFAGKAGKLENGLEVGVPEKAKEVVIRYVDWSFWVGLGVSVLGFLAWKKSQSIWTDWD